MFAQDPINLGSTKLFAFILYRLWIVFLHGVTGSVEITALDYGMRGCGFESYQLLPGRVFPRVTGILPYEKASI